MTFLQAGADLMHPTAMENTMKPMLAETVDFVIGVDTHRDSHTAAVVTAAGGLVERLTVATDAFGFRKLDAWPPNTLLDGESGRSKEPAASVRG